MIIAAAAVLAVVVLAAAAVLVVRAHRAPAKPAAATTYPPALVADGDFAAGGQPSQRGTFQSVNEVAGSGSTVVAVGSESDARVGRAQFFVSTNGGSSWRLAPVTAADGGAPPSWEVPNAVAGGHGAWLALGPGASWTSRNGQSWTRASGQGLPVRPGDQMQALTRTATGFLAAGGTTPGGKAAQTEPVTWTSADGVTWHRTAGRAAGLSVPGGTVGKVFSAATHGADTVITAQVTRASTVGSAPDKHTIRTIEADLFHSTDGGQSWTAVSTPARSGAGSWITGVAPSASGLVALRPGIDKAGGTDGAAFVSADGSRWHYGGTIDAPKKQGLQLTGVSGSGHGTVVTGRLGNGNGAPVAFESPGGRSWQRLQMPGASAFTSLAGFTVTAGGSVVAAGSSPAQSGAQQGYLSVSGQQQPIDLTEIPGSYFRAITVNGIAAAGTQQHGGSGPAAPAATVAVGSSGADPAVWYSPGGGGWFPARGATPGVFGRSATAGLSAVTHGSGGWLATGGTLGAAGQPVVVVSPDGKTWQAADGSGALAAPGASANGVAYGHGKYVIVGGQAGRGRSAAVAWWAPQLLGSGRTGRNAGKNAGPAQPWTRASDAGKGDLDGSDASRRMLAVTSAPSGFVAVGSHGNRPAAWTSPDGHRWKLVDLPAPAAGGQAELQFVTSSGRAIVATGTVGAPYSPVPFAAVSVDGGRTWLETQLPVPGGHGQVSGLTMAGGRFAATGSYGPSGRTAVLVWTSADGRNWKQHTPRGTGLAGRGSNEITALTSSGGQLLGVGFTATQASEHTTIWVAPPLPGRTGASATARP